VIIEVRDFPSELQGTLDGYLKALKNARQMVKEELIVRKSIDFEPMAHQISVAKKVIYEMNTRAILADEVGLGKTVEAGLILKEKILRKEVETALILTPASLTGQWHAEMLEKFGIEFTIATQSEDFLNNMVIASIHLAKREPHRESVISRRWDMLIVDEAHHVRNPGTQNYRLIRSIDSKFMLLLTATPVSNSLKEIYYLADLLKPGMFGTYREFESRYFKDRRGHEVVNLDELKAKLESVMIRNRRRDVFVDFTNRVVKTHLGELSEGERVLYDSILDFLKSEDNKLRVIAYAKAATSSPRAVAKMAWNALKRERNLNAREKLLRIYRLGMDAHFSKIALLKRVADTVEGGVIFTTYIETQREIAEFLNDFGFRAIIFHGGMNSLERKEAIRMFKDRGGFLVATDSGGEGLNLQFVNTMINFDLPWNPMKVEQRIGRIHRIGQSRDIYVVNLAYRDTIEEHVLNILDRKINLFRSVVGEVDAILGSLEGNFEAIVADIIMKSRTKEELGRRFEELANALEKIKSSYESTERMNSDMFSEFKLSVVAGGV